MMRWAALRGYILTLAISVLADTRADLVVVAGATGESTYATNFLHQATLWREIAEKVGMPFRTIGWGPSEEADDLDRLKDELAAQQSQDPSPLWLVFIGHGTFDGAEARFNLRGPDLTASQLAEWIAPIERPVFLLNTTSSSAPFLSKISGGNRLVITATRSGYEQSFTHFGTQFARSIIDKESDLDKDGQTSLLESFITASARVREFYESAGRLATEHALIDDNGDGLGTPAEWFRGVRATKSAADGASVDGLRAHQIHLIPSPEELALPPEVRTQRDTLELELLRLREKKASLSETAYYEALETLLLDLSRLYRSVPSGPHD